MRDLDAVCAAHQIHLQPATDGWLATWPVAQDGKWLAGSERASPEDAVAGVLSLRYNITVLETAIPNHHVALFREDAGNHHAIRMRNARGTTTLEAVLALLTAFPEGA